MVDVDTEGATGPRQSRRRLELLYLEDQRNSEGIPGERGPRGEFSTAAVDPDIVGIAVLGRPLRGVDEPGPHPIRRRGNVELVTDMHGGALGSETVGPSDHVPCLRSVPRVENAR
jgi:hypothetical protein